MATTISPAFTAANRRKRMATYGKATRPAPTLSWNEDAPSPERPRKQAGGGLQKLGSIRKSATKPTAAHDVFDVPSDDELAPPPTPASVKKLPPKQSPPADPFDVPSSADEAIPTRRRTGRALQTSRKPEPERRPRPAVQTSRRPQITDATSSDDPVQPPRRRAKTPQLAQRAAHRERSDVQAAKRPVVRPGTRSRATTPAPPTQKKPKSASVLPPKKSTVKPPSQLDIFDVPSSDEDAPLLTPRRNRPPPIPQTKLPAAALASSTQLSSKGDDSDNSDSSRKRKRRGPSQSSTATRGLGKSNKIGERLEPRSKKYQKKAGSVSPGHEADGFSKIARVVETEGMELPVNKPKRTRLRTTPAPARPPAPISRGHTSPGKLHGMLAMRSMPKLKSPIVERSQVAEPEDETMYDILDPATPASSFSKPTVAGSVTPRQKEMLTSLLGDSDVAHLDMPSIRRLQLTDRKQGSLLAGLTCSSSDIPQTTHSRKTRLIDTLMQAASSSEEEDTESGEETEREIIGTTAETKAKSKGNIDSDTIDEIDADSEAAGPSQTSQSALQPNTGSRVTYAKQRSYREETNMEDGLLLAMDLDNPLDLGGFGSNKRHESISEDDDDPASQVRGIHELRTQGENQKFQMEAQTSIDDIANKAGLGKSVRRSAMLEFCTRVANKKFLETLLESALSHQFLASIGFTGEAIFDFAACVAVAFILDHEPNFATLDEVYRSDVVTSLTKLLDLDADISRIAKDRKTNLSKVGRESVENFRTLVHMSSIWSAKKPSVVTPQIVALRTLELLVLALRKAGSTEALLNENVVCKLLDVAAKPCERLRTGKETSQDVMILNMAFSIMEALSISRDKQAMWSNNVLERLVETTSILFNAKGASPIKLATRLCLLLTNNRPKACEAFAGPDLIKPLVSFISHSFTRLASEPPEDGIEVREDLLLSLGAMINIAEFSDRARASVVVDGDELINALTTTFLEGSERAAQADSMEESHASVPIGYLTVVLGNLCLNNVVRSKIRSRLPGQTMGLLVDKVKEFVRLHEQVDQMTDQFEGAEGREASQNYTRRLMQVVRRLEETES